MHTTSVRISTVLALSLGLFGCANPERASEAEAATQQVGRVIERSLVSGAPGRVARDPGLSSFQRAIAPSQERSAFPVPAYEHKVAVAPQFVITAISESSAFSEGACVQLLVFKSPKPARILGSVPRS
jgi:hypothetical protein